MSSNSHLTPEQLRELERDAIREHNISGRLRNRVLKTQAILRLEAPIDPNFIANNGYPSGDRLLDDRCKVVHPQFGRCTLGKYHIVRHLAPNDFRWG